MKIITFAAIKGGVGKTTLAYNYGEWLANKEYQVLLIDLDHQCNLTQTYEIFESENTVANIFKSKGDVTLHHVKDNIDLIAGYIRLDKLEKELETKSYKDMLLYMWLEDHYDSKDLSKYDYIIIDCHPDFSTATRNAIIVSHAVLSPVIPSEHGYSAKFNLKERLEDLKAEAFDFKTRESYVTAELFFLGNMLKHNTKSSKELVVSLHGEDNVLALIPQKELFNRSTLDKLSLSDMKRLRRLRSSATVVPPAPPEGPVASLCRDVAEVLAALAASGRLRPEGLDAYALVRRRRQAQDTGLTILAGALEEVAERPGPAAVLRATAVLDRLRALAG